MEAIKKKVAVVRANGKAGFDKHRLFYTQRDYGLFQCSTPCCQETFDNEAVIGEMVERQENRKVPAEPLPVCPHCGSPLTMNLRGDDRFVEDAYWHRAAERYESFLRTRAGQRMLFLELGVGYNTPGIIKYPFWRMTARNPKATYACINLGEVGAPPEIEDRSILLSEDIGAALQALREVSCLRVKTKIAGVCASFAAIDFRQVRAYNSNRRTLRKEHSK